MDRFIQSYVTTVTSAKLPASLLKDVSENPPLISARAIASPLTDTRSLGHIMENSSEDSPHAIFRDLEAYIMACFNGAEVLNSSFSISRPAPPLRAASESNITENGLSSTMNRGAEGSNSFPDLDAKTLLLGDFAENGMWWTGKSNSIQNVRPRTVSSSLRVPYLFGHSRDI